MDELKPCPFCGGKAKFLVNCYHERGITRGWQFAIYCTQCDITTAKTNYEVEVQLNADGVIETITDERDKAIEVWNRRQ